MKTIMKWVDFKESISGWELVGKHMGPGYPEQELHVPLSRSSTEVISGDDGNFYTWDDYRDLWNEYLKRGGKENISDFTRDNLNKVIGFLSN